VSVIVCAKLTFFMSLTLIIGEMVAAFHFFRRENATNMESKAG